MTVLDATDATFAEVVLQARGPVLVEFWAEWCPPCRALGRVLDQIADENSTALTVVKVDADENPHTATEYGALALPTMKLFVDGRPMKTIVGAKPKAALLAELGAILA